jgi:hypothetical protein
MTSISAVLGCKKGGFEIVEVLRHGFASFSRSSLPLHLTQELAQFLRWPVACLSNALNGRMNVFPKRSTGHPGAIYDAIEEPWTLAAKGSLRTNQDGSQITFHLGHHECPSSIHRPRPGRSRRGRSQLNGGPDHSSSAQKSSIPRPSSRRSSCQRFLDRRRAGTLYPYSTRSDHCAKNVPDRYEPGHYRRVPPSIRYT